MKAEGRSPEKETIGFGRFERDGFQIIDSLVDAGECDSIAAELTPLFKRQIESTKNRIGGVRNLLQTNRSVSNFAKSPAIIGLLEQLAGGAVFPVRAIFFDKNPQANWLVPWHQDLAIAVAERIETLGFTGWSIKDGKMHVHPPGEILGGMVTLRLHLDDCDARNGALKVIPGSHRQGKLSGEEITRRVSNGEPVVCEVAKGGAVLLRPLLLHASSPAECPRHRRVLHVEYATQKLPNGLEWDYN